MSQFRYKAFVSYSHKDERWARWLHKRLETYRVPSHLIRRGSDAAKVPNRLTPIFRDREELAAADNLGEKIQEALSASEILIIICSPNAAKSHWVNQEILYFKHHNRTGKILSVIVEGEPFADGKPGAEECLPEGLRFEIDDEGELSANPAEPLAADLRPEGDGKRLGLLKLISGMLDVGLDELVQRDLQRARRRVTTITAGAFAIVLAMGTLTWFALEARREADARRADAEGQIEFMLTDLKDKLEPVGRLDALQVVGIQAADYYDQYPISEHTDSALGRRARVFHFLGEIQSTLGNLSEADTYFQKAYAATEGLLARDPNNADRIFEHAQSAFWVAYTLHWNKAYREAHPFYESYLELATDLLAQEPDKARSFQELAWAHSNLGSNNFYLGDLDKSKSYLETATKMRNEVIAREPGDKSHKLLLADDYDLLSEVTMFEASVKTPRHYQKLALDIREKHLSQNSDNMKALSGTLNPLRVNARLALIDGEIELAKEFLEIAGNRALLLVNHDVQNTDWLLDTINIYLLRTEIALIEDDREKAESFFNLAHSFLATAEANKKVNSALIWRTRIQHASLSVQLKIAMEQYADAKIQLGIAHSIIAEMGDLSSLDTKTQHDTIPLFLLEFLLTGDFTQIQSILMSLNDTDIQIYPTYLSNILAATRGFDWGDKYENARQKLAELEYAGTDVFETTKTQLVQMKRIRGKERDLEITQK